MRLRGVTIKAVLHFRHSAETPFAWHFPNPSFRKEAAQQQVGLFPA